MIFRVFLYIYLVFFSLANSHTSYADSTQVKEYVIGVEDYVKFPFQYNEDGEYKGNYRKIFDAFAKSQNIKFIYKPLKIKNLYKELFDKTIDFKFPDNKIWRSEQKQAYKMFYSQAITHYLDGIFVKIENLNKEFKTLKRVGVIDDIILQILDKKSKDGTLDIIKAKSCAELLVMLQFSEIDGIFCNYDVMNHLLKESTLENKVVLNTHLPLIDSYLHMSTLSYPEILQKLDSWILENRNFIEKLTHEY